MIRQRAFDDFWRAYRHAFWRRLSAWITGKDHQLLPYEEVRAELPFTGQRDLGAQTIPIDKIIGSVGRYRDFDRAFLPLQATNSQRWINISVARYEDVELPAIDVYKIGDVYFVKDGNHRVSVARRRGQLSIDAKVIELEVPIHLDADIQLADIRELGSYAEFLQQTNLANLRPDVDFELSLSNEYGRLLDHIEKHKYYLGLEQQQDIEQETAVLSWVDNVYLPLVEEIKAHNLVEKFPNRTPTDLYLLVSEYQWLRKESTIDEDKVIEKADELTSIYSRREVRQLIRKLKRADWIDRTILEQEEAHFFEYTNLKSLRPKANIRLTLPGKYEKLLQHISEHRWYLGEKREGEVAYDEAVTSWYDKVYLPIVDVIKKNHFLARFPNRTESDLYLWTIDHREDMKEAIDKIPELT
ncbi:MAG: hypothetical protein AAF490_19805 [Chloroflexota bacterium]